MMPDPILDVARDADRLFVQLCVIAMGFALCAGTLLTGFSMLCRRGWRGTEQALRPLVVHDGAWFVVPGALAIGLFVWAAVLFVGGTLPVRGPDPPRPRPFVVERLPLPIGLPPRSVVAAARPAEPGIGRIVTVR